jgi:hypothetical protein
VRSRAFGKHSFLGISNQYGDDRPERDSVRLQHMKAGPQREDEPVAPAPVGHVQRLASVFGGQLVVERDDDFPLAVH